MITNTRTHTLSLPAYMTCVQIWRFVKVQFHVPVVILGTWAHTSVLAYPRPSVANPVMIFRTHPQPQSYSTIVHGAIGDNAVQRVLSGVIRHGLICTRPPCWSSISCLRTVSEPSREGCINSCRVVLLPLYVAMGCQREEEPYGW